MGDLEVIADYGDLCGECPVWDDSAQRLYWVDCVGLKFYCYDWPTKKQRIIRQGLEINGFTLNAQEGFILANNSGIWWWDGSQKLDLLAETVDGRKCQMNDCTADPSGRLLAGSWFYDPRAEYPLGCLIQVDTNGEARVLDEGFHLANGLGFSPDGRTFYFTDSAQRRIYTYEYDPGTGDAKNRRVFVQVPIECGVPDGLTVDAEGFVWSAEWYGSRVVRYDPDGKLERTISTPAKQTSSVTFGGPDLSSIIITSAAKSEPMPIMPSGYDAQSGYFGGALYRANVGIRGKPALRTAIKAPTSIPT